MDNEIWVPVRDYESKYEISNFGRVKSIGGYSVRRGNGSYILEEKILSPWVNKAGYSSVKLNQDLKISRRVHRIIAEAFIPNPENKPFVDHIDGNPSNNSISNLRWCTQKENMNNPISVKRCSMSRMGKLPSNMRAVEKCSIDGCVISEYPSIEEAARQNSVLGSSITDVCRNRRKSCGGYNWKYKE